MARLAQGAAVAGYRILELIGEGATGAVYAAHEAGLDRRVALKVLAPELERDERFRERFLRESRLAASLEHPSIIPIYAAGDVDGLLYLAMRFVDGSDLGRIVEREGRLEPERALAILTQVADALDTAHARGLVHRDVKPGNILVAAGDRAYLCDFGLAKHAATVSSLSRDSAFAGTVDYIAPEQIQGASVDGRADQYSLGCVLYEALAGTAPFHRESELAIVLAHARDLPPPLSELRPELPESVNAVIERALAKDPDRRFRSCVDFVEAARDALGGEAPARAGAVQQRTFLIADVRGYTRYTQQHGDEAGAKLASAFAELAEKVVKDYDGRLIELRGDEALAAFESSRNAMRAALELQRRVGEEELPRGVGVGLDAGEAVPVGSGYRGGALNMAARLCSVAQPGQVLASEAVVHLARHVEGIRYLEGRVERLKGIERPVRVVEVVPAESADELLRRLRRRLHGRGRLVTVPVLIVLIAALVAAGVLFLGGDEASAQPNTVGIFDVSTHELKGSVDVGSDVGDVFYADGAIWTSTGSDTLVKIDPETRQVVKKFAAGPLGGVFTIGGGSVWWPSDEGPELLRIDPTYFTVDRIALSTKGIDEGWHDTASAVAYGAGSLWVARATRLERIDPSSGRVQRMFPLEGASWVEFSRGAVYLASNLSGDLEKIDPATNSVVWRTRLRPGINDIAEGGGFVWAAVGAENAVHKVRDSDGVQLETVSVPGEPNALVPGDGVLWATSPRTGTVTRIDVVSDETSAFSSERAPTGIAEHEGLLWTGLVPSPQDELAGLTGEVARFATRDDFLWDGQSDPATAWGHQQWELEYATQLKLFNYPDRPAPAGSRLVPEAAAAMPSVSADGRTYRIRVRRGFTFSPPSDAPVTAETFRYTIERTLSPRLGDFQPAELFLGDLEGLDAFREGRASHISGLSARGNVLTIRLTRPVPDLPSRLAMPFFSAVPEGTPLEVIDDPLPSAGPYYLASHNWYIVLKRNPNYEGPRPNNLDAVVYELNVDPGSAAERAVSGGVDYLKASLDDPGPLIPRGELARRYRGARAGEPRWLALPRAGIRFLQMNTGRGLFRDVKLRRAVNFAIDRKALAGVNAEPVTDQYLPPGMPGVSRSSVYPLDRPSLARARALARGRGGRAVFYTCTRPDCTARARIVKRNLAAIGITVVVRAFDNPFHQEPRWDLRDDSWYVDEYDPRDILQQLLFGDDPELNPTGYDDPRWRKRVEAAARLSGPRRFAAFGRVARQILQHSAPWASYAQGINPAFVSGRLGCIVTPPAYGGGIDIAALCLSSD